MRRTILLAVLCLVLAAPAAAQTSVADLNLPELTVEQQWQRSTWQLVVAWATIIAYGRQEGRTLEYLADYWVDLFAPSWGQAGTGRIEGVARGLYRNHVMFPDGEIQFTDVSPGRVTGWFNHPWTRAFGQEGDLYGTTPEDWGRFMELFMAGIAQHLGLSYETRGEADRTWFTVSDPRVAVR
jgi:hypothetical protein